MLEILAPNRISRYYVVQKSNSITYLHRYFEFIFAFTSKSKASDFYFLSFAPSYDRTTSQGKTYIVGNLLTYNLRLKVTSIFL